MICQFSESERPGISDCKRICLRPCFGKAWRDHKSVISYETSLLIEALTQPQFVKWLGDEKGLLL